MRASATPGGPHGRPISAAACHRRHTRLRAALALLALSGLLACGDPPAQDKRPEGADARGCEGRHLRVGIASSLREVGASVNARLAQKHPAIRIEPIFGASSTHARQLQLGAPFDVLVSADADLVFALKAGDWLDPGSIREIARGRLILVGRGAPHPFPPEQPKSHSEPRSVAALFSADDLQRIAVPSEAVPLGRYARAWLRGRNLLAPLQGKLITTEHARASLSAVEAGHVDLAFAYGSDRRLLRNARFLAEFDAEEYPPIRYVAARTKRAENCPSAQIALDLWTQPETLKQLADAGFSLAEEGDAKR